MTVSVKFFASLREAMGTGETTATHTVGMTVCDVWEQASEQLARPTEWPARMLCARNLDYVDASEPVQDGDEVAFFPPVTGG